jgi:hypothetical protein
VEKEEMTTLEKVRRQLRQPSPSGRTSPRSLLVASLFCLVV